MLFPGGMDRHVIVLGFEVIDLGRGDDMHTCAIFNDEPL